MTTPLSSRAALFWSAAFLLIAGLGIFLRIHSFEPLNGVGFDEQLYCDYAQQIGDKGVGHYPEIVGLYLQRQNSYPIALLPPTRVTFILASSTWHGLFGGPVVESIRPFRARHPFLSFCFPARLPGGWKAGRLRWPCWP